MIRGIIISAIIGLVVMGALVMIISSYPPHYSYVNPDLPECYPHDIGRVLPNYRICATNCNFEDGFVWLWDWKCK